MVGTLKTKLHIKAHQNSSKHVAYTARKKLFHKEKELKAAVAWCKKPKKGGFAAFSTGLLQRKGTLLHNGAGRRRVFSSPFAKMIYYYIY